jgi:hypothetical protein
MRKMPLFAAALLFPLMSLADEPVKKNAEEPAPKKAKDYTEFTKLVHSVIVKQTPKEFEHKDGWGAVIPLPEQRLPLPNLRTYLKDGDRVVLPHGAWKKLKLKLDDPAKDIKIRVREFKNIDAKTYRLELDAEIFLRADGEWQQWQKGLMLIGAGVQTDALVNLAVGCDVGTALNFKKLPPEVELAPKVTDLAIELKDIRGRTGPIFNDEQRRNDIKGLLRSAVKLFEPQVKELANQAIAQGLKDGKGSMAADVLLKALPK